ncbi:MAG: cell wall-binding repeat-containing protein [Clostridium sp.]
MFLKRILALTMAMVMLCSSVVCGIEVIHNPERYYWEKEGRWAGGNRVYTSLVVSMNYKSEPGSVILAPASDKNLVDTLSVAPLAYALEAPIFLNDFKDDINFVTFYMLMVSGVKKIYVPTGEAVISNRVLDILKELDIEVVRLGGKDRYETANNILNYYNNTLGKNSNKVCLVSSNGLADALSIAPVAAKNSMPIVLAESKDKVATQFEGVVKNAQKVYAIGGNGVISDSLVESVGAERIGGIDRYETNGKIINKFYNHKLENLFIANGSKGHIVDALAASVVAASKDAPIVLMNNYIHKDTEAIIEKNYYDGTKIKFLGGEALVPSNVLDSMRVRKGEVINQVVRNRNKVAEMALNNISFSYDEKIEDYIKNVYKLCKIDIGNTIPEMLAKGKNVDKELEMKGDILFFDDNNDGKVDDIGLYIQESLYTHSKNSDGNIYLTKINNRKIIAKRRFIL